MYKKIMVPLDGSELAECVLPHVEAIGRGCNVGEVEFVSVVEPVYLPVGVLSDGSSTFTEQEAERVREQTEAMSESESKDYLAKVASQVKLGDIKVKTKVIRGAAADSLADYATQNGVDLIIIATHGRSGISRWVFGSVADRILRSACVPVLMVRAPGCVPGI
jgi:nucleotide-binding universal stress UspA family protein